jgi:3-oxoadipate enol-lactonase
MAIVQVDGRAVEYELDGQGDVVVLCSPNFWPLDAWKLSGIPELSDRYQVLTFNYRGYGGSESTPTEYTVYSMADDTLSLLATLGIPRAHWIGFAYGAQVCMKASLKEPARVKTLVLAASGAGQSSAQPDPEGPVREALRKEGYRDYVRGHALNDDFAFNPRNYREHPERARALADALWERAASEEEFLKHVRARAGFHTLDDVEKVTQPTLVIVGAEDDVARGDSTPVKLAHVLAERLPNGELAVVPETRHMLFWESPEACWSRVKQFLAAHP